MSTQAAPSTPAPKIHEETVADRRSRTARLLERLRHRHYVVRRTWTLDDSLWSTDPNALEFCACGAQRRMWGPDNWTLKLEEAK